MSDLAPLPAPLAPAATGAAPVRPSLARVVAGASAAVVVVVLAVAAWWPQTDVVEVFRGDANYGDGQQQVAVLRHVRAPISALRLSTGSTSEVDHYEIVLGSDPRGDYGHHVRLDVGTTDGAEGITVQWTESGVTIRYGSGHVLSVPAHLFVGGR
jgi:hypothetical protein